MNTNTKQLVQTSLFLAAAIIVQLIGKAFVQINPLLIGPLIYTILLLDAYLCGIGWSVALSVLIPPLAVLTGAFAAPLAPFIPFIMIGNVLMVVPFGLLMNKGRWGVFAGFVIGSVIRYAFLAFSSSKLVVLFKLGIPNALVSKLAFMMGTPQLINELIGGVIMLVVIGLLAKRKVIKNYA